ncbi:MAG: lipocalin family protein [Alphaproteobacteria bacterium]
MFVYRLPAAAALSLLLLPLLLSAPPGGTDARAGDFRRPLEVDISKFTGSWYELARTRNRLQDAKQVNGQRYSACFNVRTSFTAETSSKLRIKTFCPRRGPGGSVIRDVMNGMAVLVDGSGGRKMKVAFGSTPSRMLQRLFTGGGRDYWIYCLGPVNENGRYEWAVTGGPERRFVFLLAREKTVSRQTRSDMLDCARREGAPVGRLMYRQR